MKYFLNRIGYLLVFSFPSFAIGYDLHVTKAVEWSQSSRHPITEAEWRAAVAADGQLRMDTVATAVNPDTHEVIQINNQLMASWTDPETKKKHYFYYSRGQIAIKNPSESAIKKMKALASKLGARIQGDEGELY